MAESDQSRRPAATRRLTEALAAQRLGEAGPFVAAIARHGDEGPRLLARVADAFPAAYQEDFPATVAVEDLARLDRLTPGGMDLRLWTASKAPDAERRLTVYRVGDRLLLCSDGLTDFVPDEVVAEGLAEPDPDVSASVLVDAASLGFALTPDEGRDLCVVGEAVKHAAAQQLPAVHPEHPEFPGITNLELTGPLHRTADGELTARNAVVVSPHPMARECCVDATRLLADAALRAGAPDGCIQVVEEPTIPLIEALMADETTNVIVDG